jgi:hypothetical protein
MMSGDSTHRNDFAKSNKVDISENVESINAITGVGSRSSDARQFSSTFSLLVNQLHVLGRSFPSSVVISKTANIHLKESLHVLSTTGFNSVQHVSLVYASLACVGDIDEVTDILVSCKMILNLKFSEHKNAGENQQPIRSVFQLSKWGSLSLLLPRLFADSSLIAASASCKLLDGLVTLLFEEAINSVEATPSTALVPLFNCVILTAKHFFLKKDSTMTICNSDAPYLERVINAMFGLVEDCRNSSDAMAMLDEICTLIFHPDLLNDEYERLERDQDCLTPIRDAFRRTIKMAGSQRPHIGRIVLSRICSGWLGHCNADIDPSIIGLSAIPYLKDISNLILHKEERIEESGSSQSTHVIGNDEESVRIPEYTNETSVTRGFLLVFLSKLPDPDKGLSPRILNELLHPMILETLEQIRATGSVLMQGVRTNVSFLIFLIYPLIQLFPNFH